MGMNDHVPVPDPKPKHKYANPEEAKKAEVWEAPLRELAETVTALGIQTGTTERTLLDHVRILDARVETIERKAKLRATVDYFNLGLGDCFAELKAKLKETIKAVEKLAKGKSLGALGLPTEEDWK